MASGHGIGGSVGRCYPFFAEFKECLKTEQVILSEDGKKSWKNNCWTVREDYFECLHSKKEWAMVRRVNEEEKRQAGLNKGSPSSSVPAVEVPVSPPLPMRGLANPDSLGRA